MFVNDFYIQGDKVTMGSPLGPSLANAFMCQYETTWLNECPASIKPLFYQYYIDDIFCLFDDSNQRAEFLNYMNTRDANIKYTLEREKDQSLSFLDCLICRDGGEFVTSVFSKSTFGTVYSHFNSFLPPFINTTSF